METATISQIKNRLSAYLKKVRAGKEVLILDRDEPIAKIVPAVLQDDPSGRLAALVRKGIVRPAQRPMPLEMLRSPRPGKGARVLEALLEERREGR